MYIVGDQGLKTFFCLAFVAASVLNIRSRLSNRNSTWRAGK